MPPTSLHTTLTKAAAALERGRGTEAVQILGSPLRSTSLTRDDELAIRGTLAEAWLLQGDVDQASAVLGRPPDALRETISPARLSALWRLHGRVAFERGEQSRAIALQTKALRQAELAHDSRAIGLAHYELALCYKQVGDVAIVREHITKAASALHAAGDRRYLALVHSVSGVSLAQIGRYDEAMPALRHAERLAELVQADDVRATACGNQANVMVLQHRYDEALALAERSVSLLEHHESSHRLAMALATLGQICVKVCDLTRAETALLRALEVRNAVQFHETTGAVLDTLAQVHLIRGQYDTAQDYLNRAVEAYGVYGGKTTRWYEWSIRVLRARLALRRGALTEAVTLADETVQAGAPPFDAVQAALIAVEALTAANQLEEAERRLNAAAQALDPQTAPATWGEYLRLRGALQERLGQTADAYHHFAQSATLLEMLSERYPAALSYLALGRLVARCGARSMAERHLTAAMAVFRQLGAERDITEVNTAEQLLSTRTSSDYLLAPLDADDALVRRIVDAATVPALLGREVAAALLEVSDGDRAVVFVQTDRDIRIEATLGISADSARSLAHSSLERVDDEAMLVEPLGRAGDGSRLAVVTAPRPIGHPTRRRLRMIATVARQGYALCAARDRLLQPEGPLTEQSLEPLLPGFLTASAAMARVVEQIQHLQGSDLTVLITGESGTGKELVARAIHVGSLRSTALFLPYNCTTTGRELADSQLFGHRKGSFTGAVSDQLGLVRTAESGTLFLDEIGDLSIDVQPKLLRFLEQQEIMPVGETRPQRVDVRVLAATNADLEQRVAEGKFREDLYYRLSVIRIHVPPLRERREEIPHLSTYFLREACDQLGKPGVNLSSDVLDVFAEYWWPGNIRQLKNQVQRAVALSVAGGTVTPAQLSPEITRTPLPEASGGTTIRTTRTRADLGSAVEEVERNLILSALEHSGGNISATARSLGVTRRGLSLKLRRLGLQARTAADA